MYQRYRDYGVDARQGHAVGPTDYSFSHTTYSYSHEIDETPTFSEPTQETIPLSAFSHHASAMQAIARYLVDTRRFGFTEAAKLIGRNPKSLWTSYHQTAPLPELEESLPIPLAIFTGHPPLEALVLYLKSKGMRNVDIARALKLDPKTTWTAAKRAEAKQ
jgi:hypothetical protein